MDSSVKIESALQERALYPLWNAVRTIYTNYWPDGDQNELSATEGMIQQLHEVDPDGQHLRYAHNKDDKQFSHKLPDTVDLLWLRATIVGLWNILDAGYSALLDAEPNYESNY